MKGYITLIILLLTFKQGSAQSLEKEGQDVVLTFIELIKNRNLEKLKSQISFPLRRNYPLPDIKNENEFLKRYDEVFDDNLTTMIVSSDLKNDWSVAGWRGIMLNRGTLWLDYDGRLIAVNYHSNIELDNREKLIENDKNSIHKSLNKFEQPVLILETEKFRIRIDELNNGAYRYASWSIDSTMDEKPDLVLETGSREFEGSGGNHRYEFINGNYTYECSINVMGKYEAPPAHLTVYKGEKKILYQPTQIIRN